MKEPQLDESIPELSSHENASRELVKLVRKLRWIGKDEEAKELERRLACTSATDCVLASPLDTD